MKKYLKVLMIVALAVLLVGSTFAATYAWLTAKTAPIKNTFTAGNISITLNETTGDEYKMVPGKDIKKDPKVTVTAGSEQCWLFVKIEKSDNFDTFLTATVAAGWELVSGETNIYYREVTVSDEDAVIGGDLVFSVLADDKVTCKSDVTKTQYNNIQESTRPTLTITAYAVQHSGFTTAAAAWAEAENLDQTT